MPVRKSQILGVLVCEVFFFCCCCCSRESKKITENRQRSALLARYREVCALKSKQNHHKTCKDQPQVSVFGTGHFFIDTPVESNIPSILMSSALCKVVLSKWLSPQKLAEINFRSTGS